MGVLALYFSLVLARVGTFVSVSPIFGTTTVPRQVKLGLTLALTIMYMSSLFPALPSAEMVRACENVSWAGFALALGQEAVLGALLGFAFGLLLAPARIAGEFITQSFTLAFGAQVSPTEGRAVGPLTLIIEAMAILIFLGLDLHHVFFAVLHSTFVGYPVGSAVPQVPPLDMVAGVTAAQEYGLVLGGPVVLCLLLSLLLIILLNRTAPQLNLYSIGFPLQLLVGFAALGLLLPTLMRGLVAVFSRVNQLVFRLV